jgi:cell division protein FtsB
MINRRIVQDNKIKLLISLIVFSFFFQAIGMNIQAVKSAEIKKYEAELLVLEDQVSALNFNISKSSNLETIENKAKILGFVKSYQDLKVINKNLSYNNNQ